MSKIVNDLVGSTAIKSRLFNQTIIIKMEKDKLVMYIANVSEYYDTFLSNGFILPGKKCGMITRDYLDNVSDKLIRRSFRCEASSTGLPETGNPLTRDAATRSGTRTASTHHLSR